MHEPLKYVAYILYFFFFCQYITLQDQNQQLFDPKALAAVVEHQICITTKSNILVDLKGFRKKN